MHTGGQSRHVERLGELAVDPIADLAQTLQLLEAGLRLRGVQRTSYLPLICPAPIPPTASIAALDRSKQREP